MTNNTIDQQFVEYIVKSLVSNPDAVKINRRIDEKGVLLELTVDPEDLGRVIGKRGATAQSLRTLLRALGTKQDARYNLKIVDAGDGGQRERSQPDKREDQEDYSEGNDSPSDDQTASDSGQDDNQTQDDQPTEQPTTDEQPAAPADDPTPSADDGASDRISRARKELEDLDDLDV